MNSIKKGNITELRVQLALVEKGYDVFTPITDGSSVDLIFINKENQAIKVQVKKSSKTATGFSFEARKCTSSSRVRKNSYNIDEIDYFATYWKGKTYMIPLEETMERRNVCLRIKEDYKNQNKPLLARHYSI